jgi:hypothetical protein
LLIDRLARNYLRRPVSVHIGSIGRPVDRVRVCFNPSLYFHSCCNPHGFSRSRSSRSCTSCRRRPSDRSLSSFSSRARIRLSSSSSTRRRSFCSTFFPSYFLPSQSIVLDSLGRSLAGMRHSGQVVGEAWVPCHHAAWRQGTGPAVCNCILFSSHFLCFPHPPHCRLHVFTSSRLHVFTSSRLHVFTSSHLHVFTSSRLHQSLTSRELAISSLKSGAKDILVATDVAARGLDIS